MLTSPERLILLAHAPSAKARAAAISTELESLGYRVEPWRRRQGDTIANAHRALLLWTPDAAQRPDLRAFAKRAKAEGKLVRLSAKPTNAGAALPLRGRTRQAAWRRLLEAEAPRPNLFRTAPGETKMSIADTAARTPTRTRTYPLQALAGILALCSIVSGALYTRDAGFKAQVDTLSAQAQAQVSALMNKGG